MRKRKEAKVTDEPLPSPENISKYVKNIHSYSHMTGNFWIICTEPLTWEVLILDLVVDRGTQPDPLLALHWARYHVDGRVRMGPAVDIYLLKYLLLPKRGEGKCFPKMSGVRSCSIATPQFFDQ